MRNWNQYLELWQQKRDELNVDIDVHADWSEMQDLLDNHLPVQNPGVAGSNTGQQASNLVKQLSHLVKFKLFYAIGGLILAGAIIYSVMQHPITTKNNKPDKTKISKDSVSAIGVSTRDSLQTSNTNATANKQGSNQTNLSAKTPADNTINADGSVINNKVNSTNNLTNGLGSNSSSNNSNERSRLNSRLGSNLGNNATSDSQPGRQHGSIADKNYQKTDVNASDLVTVDGQRIGNAPLLISAPATSTLNWADIVAGSNAYQTSLLTKLNRPLRPVRPFAKPIEKTKVAKNAGNDKKPKRDKSSTRGKNSTGSDLDWGVLTGIHASGSFTAKTQNHNIYGSLSPDIYLGLFGTYNFTERWALGLQGRFFTPHTISGSYNYTHKLTADTSHVTQELGISDSRKIYTVDVPIYAIYKATPNISFKAGAILSMPVKQINGTNSFTISGPLRDSAVYYNSVTDDINTSRFDKKIRVGASLGVGFTYKFLWLDATYNFQGQKVSSALGSYDSNTNSLQLTIGVKFNKSKK